MAGSNDFTGRNIQDTYQRVLQLSSSGQLADGTGSLVPLLDVTASFAISASVEIIKEVSSSFADTAATLVMQPSITVTDITASGDISASGTLVGGGLNINGTTTFNEGNITNVGIIDVDEIRGDSDNNVTIRLDGAGYQFNVGENDKDFSYFDSNEDTLIHGDAGLSRVGIGDTSPVSKLDVGGDLNVQSHITASGDISSSGTGLFSAIGIGTTTPSAKLHISQSTSEPGLLVDGGTGGAHVAKFRRSQGVSPSAECFLNINFSDSDSQMRFEPSTETNRWSIGASNSSPGNFEFAPHTKISGAEVIHLNRAGGIYASSITASGDISASGNISANTGTGSFGHVSASGDMIAKNLNTVGNCIASTFVMDFNTGGIDFRASNGTLFSNILTNANDDFIVQNLKNGENLRLRAGQSGNKGQVLIQQGGTSTSIAEFGPAASVNIIGTVTASGDISSSGTIISKYNRNYLNIETTNVSSGDIITIGTGPSGDNENIEQGKLYCMDSNQQWEEVDANVSATSIGMLGIAIEDDTPTFLLKGIMYHANFGTGVATGNPLYISEEAGKCTGTAPTTNGAYVRIIGYQINHARRGIFFDPDKTWVELS